MVSPRGAHIQSRHSTLEHWNVHLHEVQRPLVLHDYNFYHLRDVSLRGDSSATPANDETSEGHAACAVQHLPTHWKPTGASASNARKRNWQFLVKPASIIAPDQAYLSQSRSYTTSLPGCSETPFSPTAVYYLSFVWCGSCSAQSPLPTSRSLRFTLQFWAACTTMHELTRLLRFENN